MVVVEIATTTQHGAMEGKTQIKDVRFYNLDAIISVWQTNAECAFESAYKGIWERLFCI